MKQTIDYGKAQIEYSVTFAPSSTLAIDVHPGLRVTVTMPGGTDLQNVAQPVGKRAAWIERQQRELANE